MEKETTSGSNNSTVGLEDTESENDAHVSQRTSDRQSEGRDRSETLEATIASGDTSNIRPVDDRMAASCLLRLRNTELRTQNEQANPIPSIARYQHAVPPSSSYANDSSYMYDGMTNGNFSSQNGQNGFAAQDTAYSEMDMKRTIVDLSNVIAVMQQQQVGLQQQQVSMEIKQDMITRTLTNVTSLLQTLSNNAQNSSQNNCTGNEQNEDPTSADIPRSEQNNHLNERAGGDQGISRVAHDTSARRDAATLNAFPEEQRSTASQLYRHYERDTRDEQADRRGFEDRGRDYYDNISVNQSQDKHRRPPRVQWREAEYDSSERRSDYTVNSRIQEPRDYEVKLPPFNGKEDWKIWVSRFETYAERRGWSDDKKLDNLIPKLQGKAGEFVFTQLPRSTLSCYNELIKELNSRFRVVETKRTFAAQFSQRTQRQGETAEEFAAELKRLYAKAYSFRGEATRQEDLVRRFLDGLRDSEARFEVEYNKEPVNIDDAVFHVVNFVQTKRRGSSEEYSDRKFKRYARRVNVESDDSSGEDSPDERNDRVYRLPTKKDKQQNLKAAGEPHKKESEKEAENSSEKVLNETNNLIQDLVKQIQELTKATIVSTNTQQQQRQHKGRNTVCYGCGMIGHMIRDCPQKANKGGNGNSNAPSGIPGDRVEGTENSSIRQPLN